MQSQTTINDQNFLVTFSTREGTAKTGPLDLLWSLIKSYEVNLFEVSLRRITDDFICYIQKNQVVLEQKSAFSNMAAKLVFYKSKLLLPVPEDDGNDDEALDTLPKELIEKLLEHKKLQIAAQYLGNIQSISELGLERKPDWQEYEKDIEFFKLDLMSFLKTFQKYLLKEGGAASFPFQLEEEDISVEELQKWLYKELVIVKKLTFFHLIENASLSRCIGFFLAILEMGKQNIIKISQEEENQDIAIELR